ncbi:unnamed protein product [Vitrella brassicaformis CCMP3155]|uniref:Uncharacterized protein n=1 Tax=Vitrella brassicaformis (strain CCMP3155) TaxID=1169540 RepID=A0A0G4EAY3_VITBC|nr:unnamed protein product [Vitrella brassicaformis CCMP3155]|eukprot:CEL92458.1 unnamed protein product [Vitrella brassicaformis CCMP3155]
MDARMVYLRISDMRNHITRRLATMMEKICGIQSSQATMRDFATRTDMRFDELESLRCQPSQKRKISGSDMHLKPQQSPEVSPTSSAGLRSVPSLECSARLVDAPPVSFTPSPGGHQSQKSTPDRPDPTSSNPAPPERATSVIPDAPALPAVTPDQSQVASITSGSNEDISPTGAKSIVRNVSSVGRTRKSLMQALLPSTHDSKCLDPCLRPSSSSSICKSVDRTPDRSREGDKDDPGQVKLHNAPLPGVTESHQLPLDAPPPLHPSDREVSFRSSSAFQDNVVEKTSPLSVLPRLGDRRPTQLHLGVRRYLSVPAAGKEEGQVESSKTPASVPADKRRLKSFDEEAARKMIEKEKEAHEHKSTADEGPDKSQKGAEFAVLVAAAVTMGRQPKEATSETPTPLAIGRQTDVLVKGRSKLPAAHPIGPPRSYTTSLATRSAPQPHLLQVPNSTPASLEVSPRATPMGGWSPYTRPTGWELRPPGTPPISELQSQPSSSSLTHRSAYYTPMEKSDSFDSFELSVSCETPELQRGPREDICPPPLITDSAGDQSTAADTTLPTVKSPYSRPFLLKEEYMEGGLMQSDRVLYSIGERGESIESEEKMSQGTSNVGSASSVKGKESPCSTT